MSNVAELIFPLDYATKDIQWIEFECPCCGVKYVSNKALRALQNLKESFNGITIVSGARCPVYNWMQGGDKNSRHLSYKAYNKDEVEYVRTSTAFDITINVPSVKLFIEAAKAAGFKEVKQRGRGSWHLDIVSVPKLWLD